MKKRKKLETDAPPIGDRLLTLREAADVLRLSTRTVREYLQRGEIKGRIIGGRWRFRRADLDAFFENAPRKIEIQPSHRSHRKGLRDSFVPAKILLSLDSI